MIHQDKAQRGTSWARPPDLHKEKLRPKRSSPCLESYSQDKGEPGFKHRSVGEPGQEAGNRAHSSFPPWTPISQAPNLSIKIRRLPGEGSTQCKGQKYEGEIVTYKRKGGLGGGHSQDKGLETHGCLKDSKEGNLEGC